MKKEQKYFYFFLIGWTILNLVQSYFLDLNTDEAYYYFYSQNLQWGYFDHPPVIAFFVKLGYWLIPNELGVRLPFVLMSTASIYLLWKLCDSNNLKTFLKIVVSIVAIHVMGFFALPDVPMAFFCLVYLFFLQKYLVSDNIYLVLPISLSIALLFLSKYYALFVPLATIIGAPFLMKRKSFWVIVVLSIAMTIPHVLWQVKNDFISIKFHLSERNFGEAYSVERTLIYLINQPLYAGPIVGFFLFIVAFGYRTENSFERILKFMMYIFYGFFFINTFRGSFRTIWTSLAIIPLIVLTLRKLEKAPAFLKRYSKFLQISFIISTVLFSVGRVLLLHDFIPHSSVKYEYVHGYRNWAKKIQITAQNCPVVFIGKLEEPSRYMFYTHEFAHSLGILSYKRSYFDFNDGHRDLFNKRVLLLNSGDSVLDAGNNQKFHYEFYDHFATYPGIQISPAKKNYTLTKDDTVVVIPVKISRNPYTNDEMALCKSYLTYGIFSEEGKLLETRVTEIELEQFNGRKDWTPVSVIIPPEKKKYYYLRFGLRSGTLPTTLNSNTIRIKQS